MYVYVQFVFHHRLAMSQHMQLHHQTIFFINWLEGVTTIGGQPFMALCRPVTMFSIVPGPSLLLLSLFWAWRRCKQHRVTAAGARARVSSRLVEAFSLSRGTSRPWLFACNFELPNASQSFQKLLHSYSVQKINFRFAASVSNEVSSFHHFPNTSNPIVTGSNPSLQPGLHEPGSIQFINRHSTPWRCSTGFNLLLQGPCEGVLYVYSWAV